MSTGLETRIVEALANEGIASRDLAALLRELQTAIPVAEEAAEVEREKAFDPIASPDPDKAKRLVWEAEYHRDQLRAFLSRVRRRLYEVEAAEREARWQRDYEAIETERDTLAQEFAEFYPSLTTQLCDLFRRAEAIDKECSRIDGEAPIGEHRRLRGVELTARGLENFSASDPPLTKAVKLPDWTHSDRMAWPPRQLPLGVLAMMVPQHDPRFSADWAAARERDKAQRAATETRRDEKEKARQS